jgi:glycosyltransferase involved in cell wall biosynthesis
MKVCLVVSSPMTVTAFLQQPICKLAEVFEVSVVVNLPQGGSIPAIARGAALFSVGIERQIAPWRDLLTLWRLTRLFRQHRFDVVHSITPKAGLLAMLASRLAGTPVRIHIYTGQVWVTRRGAFRWLLKSMDKLIARLATHVLADSASQRQFLLNEGVVTAEQSSVLADGSISGVDTVRFRPDAAVRARIRQKLGIPEGDLVFLFLGRLNRDKGVLDLASAFAGIAAAYPHAHLLMVGPDEGNLLSALAELTADCAAQVHQVGYAARPEDYMAAADVFCLPSYREGFGTVVIEAAAAGIPAIATRIYGVVDAVEDGRTGLLFPPRDIADLQACLREMADNPVRRRQLGEQARQRAQTNFSSETVAAAWLDYYRRLPT